MTQRGRKKSSKRRSRKKTRGGDRYSKDCYKFNQYYDTLKVFGMGDNAEIKISNVNENIVIKKVSNFLSSDFYTSDQLENEVECLKILGPTGISPKYIQHLDCKEYGFIIMEKINGPTLMSYLLNNSERISYDENPYFNLTDDEIRLIALKIKMMHSYGIYHFDLHFDNIICILNDRNKIIDVKFIDFGKAGFIRDGDNVVVNDPLYSTWVNSSHELPRKYLDYISFINILSSPFGSVVSSRKAHIIDIVEKVKTQIIKKRT